MPILPLDHSEPFVATLGVIRMARVIELDPLYVDVAIHRWEWITGARVRHVNTGLSFAEVQAKGDRRIQRSLVLIHHATARTRGNRS